MWSNISHLHQAAVSVVQVRRLGEVALACLHVLQEEEGAASPRRRKVCRRLAQRHDSTRPASSEDRNRVRISSPNKPREMCVADDHQEEPLDSTLREVPSVMPIMEVCGGEGDTASGNARRPRAGLRGRGVDVKRTRARPDILHA